MRIFGSLTLLLSSILFVQSSFASTATKKASCYFFNNNQLVAKSDKCTIETQAAGPSSFQIFTMPAHGLMVVYTDEFSQTISTKRDGIKGIPAITSYRNPNLKPIKSKIGRKLIANPITATKVLTCTKSKNNSFEVCVPAENN